MISKKHLQLTETICAIFKGGALKSRGALNGGLRQLPHSPHPISTTDLSSVVFSDEATFYVSRKVNNHNIRIWGSENPCEVVEKERDISKINVWCGLMHNQIIGPFVFAESTITANIYLDMLKYYVFLN